MDSHFLSVPLLLFFSEWTCTYMWEDKISLGMHVSCKGGRGYVVLVSLFGGSWNGIVDDHAH